MTKTVTVTVSLAPQYQIMELSTNCLGIYNIMQVDDLNATHAINMHAYRAQPDEEY